MPLAVGGGDRRGRWIPWLRVSAAWLAGANRMRWRRFLFWNALGGVAWATSVGLAANFLGTAAAPAAGRAGIRSAAALVGLTRAAGGFARRFP